MTLMRTIEVIMVIFILAVAFILSAFFAVLPSPRQIASPNLRQLSLTTLEVLDIKADLSETIFKPKTDQTWGDLERALAACLPPNIVYNLTVYDILNNPDGTVVYQPYHSLSNSPSGLGLGSEASSYMVASSNVTFTVTPQKVGTTGKNCTLYILNCGDANGWWITGYTGQSLAADLYNLLSPYFETTILVNSTYQLGLLLNGTLLSIDKIRDAVVINTFGETVPIPAGYYTTIGAANGYANYSYTLGHRVRQYNWTWASIVGYPLFYVTNTETFWNVQNTYGIYGMKNVGSAGLNAFLAGLDNQGSYGSSWITSEIGLVQFTSEAIDRSNYYGIYPSPYQIASRALPQSIEGTYHLTRRATVFEPKNNYIAAATFSHTGGGALTAIGLTRTPDIRITGLGILMYYQPSIYKSEFGAASTSRLAVLQLGQLGG